MYDVLDKLANCEVKIIFFSSPSRFYEEVVNNAKQISEYSEIIENGILKHIIIIKKTSTVDSEKYKKDFLIVGKLVDSHISDWKGFQIFYNGKEGTKKRLVDTYSCYKESLDEENPDRFCSRRNTCPFGCFQCCIYTTSDISSNRNDHFDMYESEHNITPYGRFNKSGAFCIDKEYLSKELSQVLFKFALCPNLNVNNIKESIKNFPDCIDPKLNSEWKYDIDYDDKVIGIRKEKSYLTNDNSDNEISMSFDELFSILEKDYGKR